MFPIVLKTLTAAWTVWHIPFWKSSDIFFFCVTLFFLQEDPIAEVNDESVDGLAQKVEALRA